MEYSTLRCHVLAWSIRGLKCLFEAIQSIVLSCQSNANCFIVETLSAVITVLHLIVHTVDNVLSALFENAFHHHCLLSLATSYNVMSYHVVSCLIMSPNVMSCHVMSHNVMSCHVMSCLIMSCHVMSHNVISYRVMSCHIVSCHIVSCHVISCHVMSCHVS